ncbi:MAG: hypothetical protein P4L53_08830 [Candidatus Obscuribacterales bacterium]|nr:hypothetical protein [Candidatus Obscuribacterales bacterium]
MIGLIPVEQHYMRTNYRAALLLFFVPAASVELLSSNTSLAQYFTPTVFLIFNILYGAAALLAREALCRWNKGMASMMLLGMAYGMINEGPCSKGIFDPHYYAVIAFGLENVARFFGINIAWAASISAIHTIFSITVPILLVSAVFPGKESWLGNKVYFSVLCIFIAAVALAQMSFDKPFIPDPGASAVVIALILLLITAARFFPDIALPKFGKQPADVALFACGAFYAYALFFAAMGLPKICPSVVLDTGALISLLLLFLWFMLKLPETSGRAQVMLVAGLLFPQILQAVKTGNVFAAALVVILLIGLWRKCLPSRSNQQAQN